MKTFYKVLVMFLAVMLCMVGTSLAHTTPPTFTPSIKSGSVVEPGDRVTVVIEAADKKTAIMECTYSWNGEEEKSVFDSETLEGKEGKLYKVTFTFESFSDVPGVNVLNITAKDMYNNVAEEEFRYIVEPEEDNDAPTITPSVKSGSTVKAGSRVEVVIEDENELDTVTYSWNGGETKYALTSGKGYNKYTYRLETFPNVNDIFELEVTAKDVSGNIETETFTYKVVYNDPTAPEISINKKEGVVEGGTKLTLVVEDEESKVTTLRYNWEGSSVKDMIPGKKEPANKCTITNITVGIVPGTYRLHVTAINSVGKESTEVYEFVVEGEKELDEEKPDVTANPSSGKILPQEVIELTATDNEELETLIYNWDNKENVTKPINGTKDTVGVTAPSEIGEHILHVTVIDASGNKTTKDFVYTISDTKAPTVEVTPNGGNVEAGNPVEITGKDNEGLESITYNWDDLAPQTKPVGGKEATIDTTVPETPGKHILHVTVEDEDGNKADADIEFVVPEEKEDEAPTITVSPKSGSTVKGGKVVKVTLKDDIELKKVTYNWDNDSKESKNLDGTYKTIDLPKLPYKEGKYIAYITVEDIAGNVTTGKYTYYVEEEDDDEEYPTVDADPDGGEVEYGDKITITAEDEDGEVEYVEYYWDDEDDDTTIKYDDEFTVKVPSDEGKHYLYVRAMDDDDNLCDYERFTYYIEENNYPGNSDIIGDLNNRVRAVRVEIRNADDKIRFEPEEDILYYVDYYNGTSNDVKNAKLVVDLPTYLEAEKASDNGKITTKQVTWNLGTLEGGEYGRVSFLARYTSSKVNEKIITVPAKIYSGSSLKDTSTVRNMIFCEGASGTGSHMAYCVGYPDGTFLPEGRITRAELASMIANIEGITGTHRGQFTDANNHWAANYMQAVADRGYMIPKSYNYFGAQEYATRADLAYAIAAILGVEDLEPIFISATDTKNSNARCAIEQLLRLGIMDGYSDGSAKPNSNIARAEAVTIINNYLFRGELYTKGYNYAYNFETNYNHGGNSYILRFTDLSTNHWAYGHIMEATNNHRYERVMDGNEEMI